MKLTPEQTAALRKLQSALRLATSTELLDVASAQSHPDVINKFCDAMMALQNEVMPDDETESDEIFPGATCAEVAEVTMQDCVGEYETPDEVPEWKWVEENSSFAHKDNGKWGVWEFVLNMARFTSEDHPIIVPAKLVATIKRAQAAGMQYIIFHQGT